MGTSHNWKQITKVLEKIGFNQMQSYEQGFVYYIHPEKKMRIPVQKNNKLPLKYVIALLGVIKLDYSYFIPLIRRCK